MATAGRRELYGVLAACASSLTGGAAVVITRAVISHTDPATLGVLRYGIGAVCLLILVRLYRTPLPRRSDLLPIALLGILFFTIFSWLLNRSLALTTAVHGSIALSTMPLLTLTLSTLFGTERLTAGKLIGVAIATGGVVLALSGSAAAGSPLPPTAWLGDMLMVVTAFCGAVFNVLSQPYLARLPALSFTAWAMLAGTLGTTVVAMFGGTPSSVLAFDGQTWALAVALGIVGGLISLFLWGYGLEHTTPTRVAISVTLNPVSALLLGTTLLGEPWSGRILAGLGAIAVGILLTSWQGFAGTPATAQDAAAKAAAGGCPGSSPLR